MAAEASVQRKILVEAEAEASFEAEAFKIFWVFGCGSGRAVEATFHPDLISSKIMSRKFHASSSMAYHHKCPLNFTLSYGGSNFQSDFFAILIADDDS